jgi:hypothetical protein
VREEEEKERTRRLQDSGYEYRREAVAHQVAEVFKQTAEIHDGSFQIDPRVVRREPGLMFRRAASETTEEEDFQQEARPNETEQQGEGERRLREKKSNYEKQREKVAHQVAEVFKQRSEGQQATGQKGQGGACSFGDHYCKLCCTSAHSHIFFSVDEPWKEDVVQHTSDPALVRQEEEKERESRLKDKSGLEQQRKSAAYQVAEVFKQIGQETGVQQQGGQEQYQSGKCSSGPVFRPIARAYDCCSCGHLATRRGTTHFRSGYRQAGRGKRAPEPHSR